MGALKAVFPNPGDQITTKDDDLRKLIMEMIELEFNWARFLSDLANTHLRLGRRKEAEVLLRQSVEFADSFERKLQELRNREEAVRQLEKLRSSQSVTKGRLRNRRPR